MIIGLFDTRPSFKLYEIKSNKKIHILSSRSPQMLGRALGVFLVFNRLIIPLQSKVVPKQLHDGPDDNRVNEIYKNSTHDIPLPPGSYFAR